MEEERKEEKGKEEEQNEKIPYWQHFYDNVFLLFFLSIAIMAISYTIWGLMDIANVPPHPDLKP